MIKDQNFKNLNQIKMDTRVIKQTKDYDLFCYLPENRAVDMDRVKKMAEYCIEEQINFLSVNPILTNPKLVKSKKAIIDGQHRYELSIMLDEPVYFTEDENALPESIIQLNTHQKNWAMKDYLNFYTVKGNLTYVQLTKIWKENPDVPISCLIDIYTEKGWGSGRNTAFRKGDYVIKNFGKGTKIMKILNDFKPIFKYWSNRGFIKAVSILAKNTAYNHDVMMSKMEYLSTRLVRCADTDGYVQLLEDIYNYKNRDRIALRREK